MNPIISWIARRKSSTVVTLTTGEIWVLRLDGRRFRCDTDDVWHREPDGLALDLPDGSRLVWSMGRLVLSAAPARV